MNHFTNVSRLVKSIEKQRMTLLNTHLPQRNIEFHVLLTVNTRHIHNKTEPINALCH